MSGTVGSCDSRNPENDRDSIGLLIVGVLGPDPVIAKMPSMVSPQNHNGVSVQFESIKGLQHFANLRVGIAY